MAKAGKVPGIRPKRSLRENALLVVDKRLEELLSFGGAVEDASAVQTLHNLRIAAKRLRYALEMFEVCFPDAKDSIKQLTQIQEDLGDIHDLDVLTELLRKRLQEMEASVVDQAVEIAASSESRAQQSNQLRQVLYGQARDRERLGLLALIGEKTCQRRQRYAAFQERWAGMALYDFAKQVRSVTAGETEAADGAHREEQAV